MTEITDPPLMESWVKSALEDFAEELQELTKLQQEESAAFTREVERVKADVERGNAGSRPRSSSRTAPRRGKVLQQDEATLAAVQRERLLQERVDRLVSAYDQLPARRLCVEQELTLQRVQQQVEPVQHRERRELNFFSSHAADYFTMDDVLDASRFPIPPVRPVTHTTDHSILGNGSTTTLPPVGATGTGSSHVGGGHSSTTHVLHFRTQSSSTPGLLPSASSSAAATPSHRGARGIDMLSPSNTGAFSSTSCLPPQQAVEKLETVNQSPPFIIDAVEFATQHNERLKAEYGYRPVLNANRNPSDTPEMASVELRQQLESHRPGLDTKLKSFFIDTYPPSKHLPEAPSAMNSNLPLTLEQLNATAHSKHAAATAAAAASSPASTSLRTPGGTAHSPKALQTTTSASTLGIESSTRDKEVLLRAKVHQTATVVLRFTNRNADRRRLRIHSSEEPWLTYVGVSMAPVAGRVLKTVNYSSPLSCGGYLEVKVSFQPEHLFSPVLTSELQLGVTRESNSRSGVGATWEYLSVPIRCETILPQPALYRMMRSETTGRVQRVPINSLEYPHSLVMAVDSLPFVMENTGSSALFYVHSTSPAYVVHVEGEVQKPKPKRIREELEGAAAAAADQVQNEENDGADGGDGTAAAAAVTTNPLLFSLGCNEARNLRVTFRPFLEGPCEAHLVVTVYEKEDGNVVREHFFPLSGEGVAPRLRLLRIGESSIDPASAQEGWSVSRLDGLMPYCFMENTTPNLTSSVEVELMNESSVDFKYHWLTSSSRCAASPGISIDPPCGVLQANTSMTATLSVTPALATALVVSCAAFVEGLPNPDAPGEDASAWAAVDPSVMGFYQRQKEIPWAAACDASDVQLTNAFCDTYCVTHRPLRQQDPITEPHAFTLGFLAFLQPSVPEAALVPSQFLETVDCLISYENTRRATLHNRSSRPLRFIFNPTEEECDGRWPTHSEEDISMWMVPHSGVIPAFSTMPVTIKFVVHNCGPHHDSFNLYMPEVMALRDREALCEHRVELDVVGVGASVHTSTTLLDFGLIEQGKESQASFTVYNNNPVTVVVDLQDPMMREPPRFVFLPPTFQLCSGGCIEVTVYRKGISEDDAQTFFEMVVRNGGTVAMETRATIQAPTLVLDGAVLNFGEVPEGVMQDGAFFLSNLTALDNAFTVKLASPPSPYLTLSFDRHHTIRAGQRNCKVPVKATFHFNALHRPAVAADGEVAAVEEQLPYHGLLGIRSLRNGQTLLVEVRCDVVHQLLTSVNIREMKTNTSVRAMTDSLQKFRISPSLAGTPATATGSSLSVSQHVDVMDATHWHSMETSEFIRAMLQNLVEEVMETVDPSSVDGAQPHAFHALCPTLKLFSHLTTDWPVTFTNVMLGVKNYTGCISQYRVDVMGYPLWAYELETYLGLDGAPIQRAALNNTTNSKSATGGTGATSPGIQAQFMLTDFSRHTQISPLPLTDGVATAVPFVSGYQSSFWTTYINGVEARERENKEALIGAQRRLLDGRGSSTLQCAPEGPVLPHGALSLPLMMVGNLPGRYNETLRVSFDGFTHAMDIPIEWEVEGRPLLLDPTTSGLTTSGQREVLLLPAVIASVGASRRHLRLINRIPRDVNVSISIFMGSATFYIEAEDGDVPASEAVLRLVPLTQEAKAQQAAGKGRAAVTPSNFFMAANSTREVWLQYEPDMLIVRNVLDRLQAASISVGGVEKGFDGSDDDDVDNGSGSDGDDGDSAANAAAVPSVASQETPWEGSVLIHAELAESAFNDAFLIDEFYEARKDTYPSIRCLEGLREASQANEVITGSGAQSGRIHGLQVRRPLRSRRYVLRKNKLLFPSPAERLLLVQALEANGASPGGAVPCTPAMFDPAATTVPCICGTPAPTPVLDSTAEDVVKEVPEIDEQWRSSREKSKKARCAEDDDDDDEEEEEEKSAIPLIEAMASGGLRAVADLEAEERERRELLAYLLTRRAEVREVSRKYFTPIELLLRARCGVPFLDVQPSHGGVYLPIYRRGQWCGRTVQLTNFNSATVFVALEVDSCFRITALKLIPAQIDGDSYMDDELVLSSSAAAFKQQHQKTTPAVVGDAYPFSTLYIDDRLVYRLQRGDTLNVTVEVFDPETHAARTDPIHHKRVVVQGELNIYYYDGTGLTSEGKPASTLPSPIAPQNTAPASPPPLPVVRSSMAAPTGAAGRELIDLPLQATIASAPASATSPAVSVVTPDHLNPGFLMQTPPLIGRRHALASQDVPLFVAFRAPAINLTPLLTWLRPGERTHDGRPQPKGRETVLLYNLADEEVGFRIVHVPRKEAMQDPYAQDALQARSCGAVTSSAQLHMERKVREVVRMPKENLEAQADCCLVDDPTAFSFSAMEGVLPPASMGGQPGMKALRVSFQQHSNVRFESFYRVLVDGKRSEVFFILRGDSRETEL